MNKKICKEKGSSKERIYDYVGYTPRLEGYPTVSDINELSEMLCLKGKKNDKKSPKKE